MCTKVRSERNGSAETEQYAQCVHGNVDDGDAEFVEKRGGEEVQQGQEPPYSDEKGVVDNGVGAVRRAVNVVGHECRDEDGADELSYIRHGFRLSLTWSDEGIPARREGPWRVLATPC